MTSRKPGGSGGAISGDIIPGIETPVDAVEKGVHAAVILAGPSAVTFTVGAFSDIPALSFETDRMAGA